MDNKGVRDNTAERSAGKKTGQQRPESGCSPQMKKRFLWLSVFICGLVVPVLIGSLVNIQFFAERDGKSYAELALENQLQEYRITPTRGSVLDANGKVLAQNATAWTVAVYPNEIRNVAKREATEEAGAARVERLRAAIADNLSEILEMSRETIYEMTGRNTEYVAVKRKVEKPAADLVSEFMVENSITKSVSLRTDSKRYYPYGDFMSTVLGFTGTDNQGLYGLEYFYDEALAGVAGRVITLKNGINVDMPSEYESVIEPIDGANVKLTVDEVLQMYLEKHLDAALNDHNVNNRVAGIIMDVKTGGILAMSTKGDFDPNQPFVIADEEAAEKIESTQDPEEKKALTAENQQSQWKNKIVGEVYEPGSVFKIITAAAALEEGVVKASDTFTCTGKMQVASETIHCWKRDGSHGTQTFVKGLCNSCNPVFMTIASRLGVTKFMQYYEAFGLTEKTGIDLPGEEIGISHTASKMGVVELAVSSFGQTFKVTPLQMITAISAVANGGYLMQPYIVDSIIAEDGTVLQKNEPVVRRQVISAETSKELCAMLGEVVSDGSGRNAYVAGYRVAGKTGTSEKTDLYDENGERIEAVIASFCGFAPADDPQIAVLFLMDEPHSFSNFGGQIAAPVVADIMEDALKYLGVEPQYTEAELQRLNVAAPDVVGKTLEQAQKLADKAKVTLTVVGNGSTVMEQIPAALTEMPQGGKIVVVTDDTAVRKVVVPDLLGKSLGTANSELANRGLNITIKGVQAGASDAVVLVQSLPPGTEVSAGTVIELRIGYADQVH